MYERKKKRAGVCDCVLCVLCGCRFEKGVCEAHSEATNAYILIILKMSRLEQ